MDMQSQRGGRVKMYALEGPEADVRTLMTGRGGGGGGAGTATAPPAGAIGAAGGGPTESAANLDGLAAMESYLSMLKMVRARCALLPGGGRRHRRRWRRSAARGRRRSAFACVLPPRSAHRSVSIC